MKKEDKQFLFDLLNTPSPTGFELEGQRKWAAYVGRFADEVSNDAYGTAWATLSKKREAPLLMLEAHADEIGFMIKHITKEGFLHVDRIGGSDAATARGRRLKLLGSKGPVLGVIGNTAIHIRDRGSNGEKAPEVHQLHVDVGASNPEEVSELGLRVGHPGVYSDTVEEFGTNRLVGRALDNRIGGFIIARVLANLVSSKRKPAVNIVAVNAVQEEIGGLGAKMVTHRLCPDAALCVDVTHATDTPKIEHSKHGSVRLGRGPTITHGSCNHPNVVARLIEVAERRKIPVQHESSSRYGGTDTDRIYHERTGVPSALVSLPLRYMHSVVEVVDLQDVSHTISLMTEFAKAMRPTDDFGVKL